MVSLQAGPYTQALFLPSVTFCSKLCPLLKSLRSFLCPPSGCSQLHAVTLPPPILSVSESPFPCSFSAHVQGRGDLPPVPEGFAWLNHPIYRNVSKTVETAQVKHTACHKAWSPGCYPGKLMESLDCFFQTTVESLLCSRQHSGVFFANRNTVKIQINLTHGIWICRHLISAFSMMQYSLWQLYSPVSTAWASSPWPSPLV